MKDELGGAYGVRNGIAWFPQALPVRKRNRSTSLTRKPVMKQHGERSETSRSSRMRNAHYTDMGRGMQAVSRRAAPCLAPDGHLTGTDALCQHPMSMRYSRVYWKT